MMAVVISSPGLLFGLPKEVMDEYDRHRQTLGVPLQSPVDASQLTVTDDAYTIEELSYRARIFLFTHLEALPVKRALIRFNLDSFVTNVVSCVGVGHDPSRVSLWVRDGNWIFLTNNEEEAKVMKGVKTIVIGKGKHRSIQDFVDSLSSHQVDESFYAKGCKR